MRLCTPWRGVVHSGEERCSGRLENGARVYIFRFRVRHVFTVRGGWRETEHGNPSRGSDKWRARLFALSRFLSVLLSNDGRRRVFYGNNVVVWLGRGRVERLVYFERRCRRSTRAPTSSRRRFLFVCRARPPSLCRTTTTANPPAGRGRARILWKNQCARIRSTCAVRRRALR